MSYQDSDVTNKQLIDKALIFYNMFERKTRDNGENFYCLKDGSPQILTDLIYTAHSHGEFLPDDFIYSQVHFSLSHISDMEEDSDREEWYYDIEPDCYNHDLLKWVSSNLNRMAEVDEVIEECQGQKDLTLSDFLMRAQQREKEQIFLSVLESLTEIIEEEIEKAEEQTA